MTTDRTTRIAELELLGEDRSEDQEIELASLATDEANDRPMQFAVIIDTDNAAFEGDDCDLEVARILRKIADRLVDNREIAGSVNDVNGNRVCVFGYEDAQ